MHKIAACIVLFTLMAIPQYATAQSYDTATSDVETYRRVMLPRTLTEEYIFQRAVLRGRQRVARLEVRKWLRQSPLRPNVYPFPLTYGSSPAYYPGYWPSTSWYRPLR